MKKLVILSVMLLVSITCLGQNNNLPDALSVKDAIAIYNGGMEVAKSKLAELGYKSYGKCGIYNCWSKNCDYSCDLDKASKFGKGTSSVVNVEPNEKEVRISVFNKGAFQKLKSQIVALGYKKIDEWGGSGGNHFDVYSKNGFPNITAADESMDSNLPYTISVSKE